MTRHPPVSTQPSTGKTPSSATARSDLAPRVASAIVLVALAFATLWAGGQIFVLFWLIASFAVLWEWQRLLGAPGYVSRLLAGAGTLALCAALVTGGYGDWAIALLALGSAASGALAWQKGATSSQIKWIMCGVFYAGSLLIAVLILRLSVRHGIEAILWLFAIVWGTDILAYFSGRSIGGPKLLPSVSPSKTWSGLIGGVLGGAIAGTVLLCVALPAARTQWPWMFLFAVVLALVSQGGDLFESSLKRRYGVKDSSALIPGHGGAMDRLDGFTAAAVLAALIGLLHGGPVNSAYGLLIW
jgi:phosphatidate cytidylyltransferase